MALVVEDGTGKTDAQTYATVEDLKTFAPLRGIDLSEYDDPGLEVLLIKAMDYIESKAASFKGHRANAIQALQWPRADVWDVDFPGALLESTEVPRQLVYAQMQLAIDAMSIDLQPNQLPTDKGPLLQEKIEGVITKIWDKPKSQPYTPGLAKAEAHLAPLLKRNGLSLVRT